MVCLPDWGIGKEVGMLVESRYLQTDQENPLSPFFYVLLFLRQEEGMSVEQPTLYGYLGCFVFCFLFCK